jgi:hypothetical protein
MGTDVILAIVQTLFHDAGFKAALGKKILALWLKYKIFELLDVIKDENKRKKVIMIIKDFRFVGSSL